MLQDKLGSEQFVGSSGGKCPFAEAEFEQTLIKKLRTISNTGVRITI